MPKMELQRLILQEGFLAWELPDAEPWLRGVNDICTVGKVAPNRCNSTI